MSTGGLFNLEGEIAVITGGATGLGRQIAEAFADAGAHLVICARDFDRCRQAADELGRHGKRALGLHCDVTSESDVTGMVQQALSEFGRVDILVNNSGLAWAGSPESLSLHDWQRVLDVNLNGVFLVSQAVGRVMITQNAGRIINIASIAGIMGSSPEVVDTIAYSTSKAAVIHFTRDLACKWARHGIRVNCIAPGWFSTKMSRRVIEVRGEEIVSRIPLGRLGNDDDLKGAAVFLASAASSYITGQTFVVDGGMSLL